MGNRTGIPEVSLDQKAFKTFSSVMVDADIFQKKNYYSIYIKMININIHIKSKDFFFLIQ